MYMCVLCLLLRVCVCVCVQCCGLAICMWLCANFIVKRTEKLCKGQTQSPLHWLAASRSTSRERERAKQINKPDNNTKNLQKNNSVAAVAAAAACRFLYLSQQQQQQQKLAAKCKIMKNYRLSFAMSCGDDCGMH